MTDFNFSQNLKTIVALKIPSAKEIEHFYFENSNKITTDNFMSFIENKISFDFFSQHDIDMKPVNIEGMLKNIEDNQLEFDECNVLEALANDPSEACFKIKVNAYQAFINIIKSAKKLNSSEAFKLAKIVKLIQNPEFMDAKSEKIFERKAIEFQSKQMTNA